MASISFDLRNPRRFDHDPALVEFLNGNVSLRLASDFTTNLIQNIIPTQTTGSGTGLENIGDTDPSTKFVDQTSGDTVLVWDFGGTVHLAGFDLTLTQDIRRWEKIIVEVDDDALFPSPTVVYASGEEGSLFPIEATDPDVALTLITKRLTRQERSTHMRLTLRAAASSPDDYRVISTMKVYGAAYPTTAKLVTTDLIDTIDVVTLMDIFDPVSQPAGTSVTYTIYVNGIEWYYDGFSWKRSNGTSLQSSTSALLTGQLSNLLAERNRSRVRIGFFLNTVDTAETPTLAELTLTYSETAPAVAIPTTRLTGILYNAFGIPISGATVTATFVPTNGIRYVLNDVRVVTPPPASTTTDANGHFSISVTPTTSMVPSSGNPADIARWQLVITASSLGYTETRLDEVSVVDEIDIFQMGWGA